MKAINKKGKVTCNQCGYSWVELDGITQAVQCPKCHQWDVTIENIRKG